MDEKRRLLRTASGHRHFLFVALACAASCAERDEESQFDVLKEEGGFELVAETLIDGDRIEFWLDSPTTLVSRLLIAARDGNGRLLDFCEGAFRSSSRPFFKNKRYAALAAATPFSSFSLATNA